MTHMGRFKLVYIQVVIAFSASAGGELSVFKDMTKAELAALTWVTWLCCAFSIITAVGNQLLGNLAAPPPAKDSHTTTATVTASKSETPPVASS